jgi:hypothetical protein
MRFAIAAALLVLGACQPAAAPTSEETGQDDPGAPFTPALVGPPMRYDAYSKTAMSFTPGGLTLTPTPQTGPNMPSGAVFAFGNGIRYETTLMPGAAMEGDPAKQPNWRSLFVDLSGAPIEPMKVDVYAVDAETVPPGTPNGGFCDKTSFLATYTVVSPGAEDITLAAFSGEQWPPKDETALCGTFTYGSGH